MVFNLKPLKDIDTTEQNPAVIFGPDLYGSHEISIEAYKYQLEFIHDTELISVAIKVISPDSETSASLTLAQYEEIHSGDVNDAIIRALQQLYIKAHSIMNFNNMASVIHDEWRPETRANTLISSIIDFIQQTEPYPIEAN